MSQNLEDKSQKFINLIDQKVESHKNLEKATTWLSLITEVIDNQKQKRKTEILFRKQMSREDQLQLPDKKEDKKSIQTIMINNPFKEVDDNEDSEDDDATVEKNAIMEKTLKRTIKHVNSDESTQVSKQVYVKRSLNQMKAKKEVEFLRKVVGDDPLIKLELINEGSFGKVYKGIYALRKGYIAIKYSTYFKVNDFYYEQALNEANLLSLIKNNIEQKYHKYYALLDFYREMEVKIGKDLQKRKYMMVVQDYGDCSLKDLMDQRRFMKQCWSEQALIHIFRQIVEGFYQLSREPLYLYHRDIKPGNIVFYKTELSFMIIDFGESQKIIPEDINIKATYNNIDNNLRGTPRYLDPLLHEFYYQVRQFGDLNEEQWNQQYGSKILSFEKADVYSLGYTFLEMLDLGFEYSKDQERKFIQSRLKINEKFYPSLVKVLKSMLEKDSSKRIGYVELKQELAQIHIKLNDENLNCHKLFETDLKIARMINKQLEMKLSSRKIEDVKRLVTAYEKGQQYEKAIFFQQIIIRRLTVEQILKANYSSTEEIAEAKQKLGDFYKLFNKYPEALQYLEEAEIFYQEHNMKEKIQELNIGYDIIFCYRKLGDDKKADGLEREILRANRKQYLNKFIPEESQDVVPLPLPITNQGRPFKAPPMVRRTTMDQQQGLRAMAKVGNKYFTKEKRNTKMYKSQNDLILLKAESSNLQIMAKSFQRNKNKSKTNY